jgi:hypothetical protein
VSHTCEEQVLVKEILSRDVILTQPTVMRDLECPRLTRQERNETCPHRPNPHGIPEMQRVVIDESSHRVSVARMLIGRPTLQFSQVSRLCTSMG